METPPALTSVHNAYAAYHHWGGTRAYGWLADRTSTSTARRWHLARVWWDRAAAQHTAYLRRSSAPSWFQARMPCLAQREEGGHNSWAGFFGMVYPPSSYPGSAIAVLTYGNSWWYLPWAAQVGIVWAEYQAFGSSPWPNTAPGCGL